MNIRQGKATTVKKGKRRLQFAIDKRQKFVLAVIILSLGLFFTEYQLTKWGLIVTLIMPFLTVLFLLWAVYEDLKENKLYQVVILPFIYTFAFGFFYLLTPTSFVIRLILSVIYAFGLYSLFLSQNIFVVSSSRTIQLLSGARIVSFVITLISYFFLTNIVFSFHIVVFPVIVLIAFYTYFLIYHSLWTYTLQKYSQPLIIWVSALTACIIEVASLVWFWPTNPTVMALFLTGFFYSIVGLSHIWFEKRFFKGILWEYVWVGAIVFFVLLLFTQWGK
ncbi:MAG TPA: hypothetical protein VLF89_06980 [Candidatus Saccharimonadales bacterium]|nr:hypothetical protein [Candidatus Saccharimonadales bacterium]